MTTRSLNELGTEYIDLLLIHWPSHKVEIENTLDAMRYLQSTNMVKSIGVSNFTNAQFKNALAIADNNLLGNEILYNPFNRQESVLKACREEDKLLIAYSPLAKGMIFHNEILNEIGQKYRRSPAQVALRWLTQQENVVAIPKATTQTHLEENVNIFNFQLDEDEMNQIARIKGGILIRSLHKLPSLVRSIPI